MSRSDHSSLMSCISVLKQYFSDRLKALESWRTELSNARSPSFQFCLSFENGRIEDDCSDLDTPSGPWLSNRVQTKLTICSRFGMNHGSGRGFYLSKFDRLYLRAQEELGARTRCVVTALTRSSRKNKFFGKNMFSEKSCSSLTTIAKPKNQLSPPHTQEIRLKSRILDEFSAISPSSDNIFHQNIILGTSI